MLERVFIRARLTRNGGVHNHKNNPRSGESSREIERTPALTRAIKRLSELLPPPTGVITLQRARARFTQFQIPLMFPLMPSWILFGIFPRDELRRLTTVVVIRRFTRLVSSSTRYPYILPKRMEKMSQRKKKTNIIGT